MAEESWTTSERRTVKGVILQENEADVEHFSQEEAEEAIWLVEGRDIKLH